MDARSRFKNIHELDDIAAIRADRKVLINLRIEVELLLFISQTSMNLQQTRQLRFSAFHFTRSRSRPNCVDVTRDFKPRRSGEVLFSIYPQYKARLLEYLAFRSEVFPDDDQGLLFKFVCAPGKERSPYYDVTRLQKKFKSAGVPFLTPRALRRVRLDFFEKRSGNSLIAAEMGQHSPATRHRHYRRPDVSDAFREVASFLQGIDEAIEPPLGGRCERLMPTPIADAPPQSPTPDCRSPAGCLFCNMQRDLPTMDHIWSLASYRYLKSIELSKYRGKDISAQPSMLVIRRIAAKIDSFASGGEEKTTLVKEVEDRIQERWFHPAWDDLIEFAEVGL